MSVHAIDLSFTWPDGSRVLRDVGLDLHPGLHAVIGDNGAGKSTLLRILAADLAPASGHVRTTGSVRFVPQSPHHGGDVATALGIAPALRAIDAVEQGSVDPDHFDAIGDAWDIGDRAAATLDRLGLGRLGLDRPTRRLSGGEHTLLAVAAAFLARPDTVLLDEPTNNLDERARSLLFAALRDFRGTILLASHDTELLRMADDIAELHDGSLRWFGGLDVYEEAIAAEQDAAERAVRDAKADVHRQRRERADNQEKLAHRAAVGKKAYREKRVPRVVMRQRRSSAQVSSAKLRATHDHRLAEASSELSAAEDRLRDEPSVRIDLPLTRVPAKRGVVSTEDLVLAHVHAEVSLDVTGPERIVVTGANGSGKSTLLRTIAGLEDPAAGSAKTHVPARFLPQHHDLLDPGLDIVDNVRTHAPQATPQHIRGRLARFGFPGDRALLTASALSGGERLRATLACLLLTEPAPQLLILDEPTNNLDRRAVDALLAALRGYQGALIVASHDPQFRGRLSPTRELHLGETEGVVV